MQRPASSSTRATHTRAAGFSLIELMITIAIAAILTTIAVASYQNSIRKARRTDAKTALLDLAGREERYYSLNNAYTDVPGNLGYTGAGWPIVVGGAYYQISVAPPGGNPPTFTLTAVPIGNQALDTTCSRFQVDNTGKQSSTDGGGADSTAACW